MDAPDPPLSETQAFSYSSLDLSQRSIRLIRVLPTNSNEGYIQCEMRYASVESEYDCLSYVWGPPTDNWITIDGQLHSVRDNLLAFLEAAQEKSMSSWLWIDAICIDQINNAERTHQVQQMSNIFSNAQRVLAWLGTDVHIAAFLYFVGYLGISSDWMEAFVSSDYWKRAWVTQEIFLARRVILLAASAELPLENLPDSVLATSAPVRRNSKLPKPHYTQIWPTCFLDSNLEDWRSLQGKSLVHLVLKLRHKQCVESQDRVYSVLGLCGEGSDLRVEYKRTNEQLALAVLLSCKTCFCLCSVYEICAVLGVEVGHGSFSCPVSSNIWKHHHVNVSIPLEIPDSGSSKPETPAELFLTSSGLVSPATLADACCSEWSEKMHAHHIQSSQIGQRPRLTISMPPKSLCKNINAGFILSAHNGLIAGHCYTRPVSVVSEDTLFWVSKTEIFRSIRPITEDLRYDGPGGTVTFSLALLFWLGNLYTSSTDAELKCCSAYKDGQSVLRLCGE